MNHQRVSETFFEETYAMPHDQTARSLFARLPHRCGYAQTMIECLATGYLVAVIESMCIREMQGHVDPIEEVVVGRTVRIEHRAPIPPATRLRVGGWTEGIGERSATFRIRAHDDHELVLDGTVTLVAALRASIEPRIARKLDAIALRRSDSRS